jgi:hypothetical protein
MANVPPGIILQQGADDQIDSIWMSVRKTLSLRLKD